MSVEKLTNNTTLLGDLHHKYETLPGYSRSETREALGLLQGGESSNGFSAAELILHRKVDKTKGLSRLIVESYLGPINKLAMLLGQRESELVAES